MMTISDEGLAPDRVAGAYISANGFRVIGAAPFLGRDFETHDDEQGAPAVVILGHRLWTSRYGADPSAVGRTVRVNGVSTVVIGVMPEGFAFPFLQTLWQPLASRPGLTAQPRDARTLGVCGRLADGVSAAQGNAELNAIAARQALDHPGTNTGVQARAVRFGEQQVGRLKATPGSLVVIGTAVFALLIACANVANLLLARAAGRSQEISIRASVGATRWRIVRQLLVESVLLAFAGGALGLWLSTFGVRIVSGLFEGNVPYWLVLTVDGRVLTLLAGVCFLASLLFGLAPALYLSKTDVNGVLKDGGRTGIAPRVRRWTNALLVAELALTLVLLAAAGLMVRSFLAMYRADRLIDTSRLLAMELALPDHKYPTPEQRAAFYEQLQERLDAIPAISSASVASDLPFVGAPGRLLSIDGRPADADERPHEVSMVAIGPRYFETLGLRRLRGRAFTNLDGRPGHDTAIVNQRFAEIHFPDEEPIGQRIRLSDPKAGALPNPWLTIVGVSPDVRQDPAHGVGPAAYVPYRAESGATATLMVGIRSAPGTVVSRLRQEIGALDADVPLFNIRPLDEVLAHSRSQHRLFGTVLGMFAIVALILSTVGVYAITAYAVVQRTQEIGLRMALGAQSQQVVWLFVRRGMVPLGIGLAIGLGGAVGVGALLRGLLIQTSPTDPITLLTIVTLLVVVAVAACLFPARRAARLDPLVALRYE